MVSFSIDSVVSEVEEAYKNSEQAKENLIFYFQSRFDKKYK